MSSFRAQVLLVGIVSIFASGCTALMGNLRKDLDDGDYAESPSATYGGPMAEGGFLAESMGENGYTPDRQDSDRYMAVGHSERNPASESNRPNSDGWAARDRDRDPLRGSAPEADVDSSQKSSVTPPVKRMYKNGMRATRADFIDESPNEGSLWASDGQTNYYFTKNKIRGLGDIVTLTLDDPIVKDMALEVRKRLSQGEMGREIAAAQARIRKKVLAGENPDAPDAGADKNAQTNAAPPIEKKDGQTVQARVDEREIPLATEADIDLSKSLEVKAGETMLGEIMERYPNGNYKIRATKRIPYKNGAPRLMNVIGVVRGADITEDDQIAAGKLYEYRLEAQR